MRLTDALTRISYELRGAHVKGKVRVFVPSDDYARLQYELQQVQRMPSERKGYSPHIEICGNIEVQPLPHLEDLERAYDDPPKFGGWVMVKPDALKQDKEREYQRGYNAALADMHERVKDTDPRKQQKLEEAASGFGDSYIDAIEYMRNRK